MGHTIDGTTDSILTPNVLSMKAVTLSCRLAADAYGAKVYWFEAKCLLTVAQLLLYSFTAVQEQSTEVNKIAHYNITEMVAY